MRRIIKFIQDYVTIPTLMIYLFGLISVLTLLSFLFDNSSVVISIESKMQSVTYIAGYGAMLFSAIALFVSALAYRLASNKPKLSLDICTVREFSNALTLSVERETGKIPNVIPRTSWEIKLANVGGATARYPIVYIEFQEMYFDEHAFPGWAAAKHAHSQGWFGFQWDGLGDIVIHPGFPLMLPPMHFAGKFIKNFEELHQTELIIYVTVATDGFIKRRQRRAVKLEHVSHQ